ncbi:MAG: transposase [Moorea sp. SIO1F2]|nr:transposase [Moorena sp. SIO1F2]
MPNDFPPSSTVYRYFRVFERFGVWKQINQKLRRQLRTSLERGEKRSYGIIDSQSVKTTGKRGKYMVSMAGKKSRDESDIFS